MPALPRLWWTAVALVAALAPIPMGSVNTEWSMPLAVACTALGLLGFSLPAAGGERGASRVPTALLPIAALALLAVLQAVPLPRWAVSVLSPERLRLPPPPGPSGSLPLSVQAAATLEWAVMLLGVFYLSAAVARQGSRAGFRLLAAVGALHAAAALALFEFGVTGHTRFLFVYRLPEVLTPFATYPNKNHFAGLMVICAGGAFAILFRRWGLAIRKTADLGFGARLSALTGRGFLRLMAPGAGIVLMVLAILGSGSRGAALALFGALLTVAVAGAFLRRRSLVLPVLAIAVLGAGGAWVAAKGKSVSVVERLVPGGRYLNRPRLWRNSVEVALRYPMTGSGLGTFAYVFPPYQEFEPERAFTHAESDWVQHAVEAGVPGVAAVLLVALLALRQAGRAWRRAGVHRCLLVGGCVGLGGIVLHGFLDIPLHIPANLVAAGVLLGSVLGVRERAPPAETQGGTGP